MWERFKSEIEKLAPTFGTFVTHKLTAKKYFFLLRE